MCREVGRGAVAAGQLHLVEEEGHAGLRNNAHALAHGLIGCRVYLRGATGDDDTGAIVGGKRVAHGLASFLVGLAGDGAGVHDDEVGRSLGRRRSPALPEQPLEAVGLHAVHLAAEVHHGITKRRLTHRRPHSGETCARRPRRQPAPR